MSSSLYFPKIPQTLVDTYQNMGYKSLDEVPQYIRLPYEWLIEPVILKNLKPIVDAKDTSSQIIATCNLAAGVLSTVALVNTAYASPAKGAASLAARVTGLPILAMAAPVEIPHILEPLLEPHLHLEVPTHDIKPLPPEIIVGPVMAEVLRGIFGNS